MTRRKDQPEQLAEIRTTAIRTKQASVARVLARRRAPEYREVDDPRGCGVYRFQVDDGGFAAPESLAEWADDAIARMPAGVAPYSVLVEIVDAARTGGQDAAVAAVAKARLLLPLDQHAAWSTLSAMYTGVPDAARLLLALRGEWRRLRLNTLPSPYPFPSDARADLEGPVTGPDGPADSSPGRTASPGAIALGVAV